MWIALGWFGLFAITFLSATLLPFSSEFVLLAFLSKGFDPIAALFIATIGNSLGGATNYFIGAWGGDKWKMKFGATSRNRNRLQEKIQKYGPVSALLAWTPFVGDLIMLVLGIVHARKLSSFVYMTLGKFLRYYFIVFVFEKW